MMVEEENIYRNVRSLRERSPVHDLQGSDRIVVVSDLHMGDGSYHDDFRKTSNIFTEAFEKFYLDRGFRLVLNGDVEELLKFRVKRILDRWRDIYSLFERFQDEIGLYKILGNHDWDLGLNLFHDRIERQFEAVRFKLLEGELFFLHGHQGSHWLERLHNVNKVILRNVVSPLKLRNFALTLDHKPVTKKEHRLSRYASMDRVLTFMGHTHRPLFGSHDGVPGLFNSGAAIGRRGITTLEIEGGFINLVHWWGRDLVKRYLKMDWFDPERLKGTDIYRVVLDRANLSDVFREQAPARSF
jgi:UDP-2,3-diacylglucosamine pyrophosphatase LpxH